MLWLIVNPSARDGRTGDRLGATSLELTRRGLDHVVHPTLSLEHARELAAEAVALGAMPVSFGGDGLIGAVAGIVADAGAAMGILPGGRGNDIARGLGIPRDPRAACDVLARGVDRPVDLGMVGDRPFLGIATCGFDSLANRIANETRLVRGSLAYSYGGLRALAEWRPARFELVLDGVPKLVEGYTVAVANARSYGGGMLLAPEARTDDGLLDVVVIAQMSKLRFLRHMPEIFVGSHLRLPEVSVHRVRRVEVRSDRPLGVFADGEPAGELPTSMSIRAHAVRIRVPA